MWFGIGLLTWAIAGEPRVAPPVLTTLSEGVEVDWTQSLIRVRTSVAGEGISPRQLLKVEQQASMSAEETMAYWAGKVPLGRNRMLGDVRTDIAEVLPGEVRVASTRYDLDSGSVVVELVVDLVTLAGPWLRATAETMPIQTEEAGASGVVLDARGLDIRPSLAPQIVDAEGTVIWGGQVWSNLQKAVPPVRWATDPTDHAVRVAGNVPELFIVAGATDTTLVLSAEDARRFRRAMDGRAPLGSGAVAIVVDP